MERRKRKSYSREFKMEAVRLITHKVVEFGKQMEPVATILNGFEP